MTIFPFDLLVILENLETHLSIVVKINLIEFLASWLQLFQ